VYVLLIGAFVQPIYGSFWAGICLLVMHVVGALVALPIAWLLNRVLLKTPPSPFVLEMPPYRLPSFQDTMIRLWSAAKEFIIRAGTIIFAITLIIWAMLYFPRPESVEINTTETFIEQTVAANPELTPAGVESALDDPESELSGELDNRVASAYVEQSIMGRLGKAVQPVFDPAGFDWKITIGVLASFPAREVIISTLGTIYSLSGDVDEESGGLRQALRNATWESGHRAGQPVFTLPVVFAIMVFFALCMQCGATVAAIVKESSWRWGIFSFVYMTAIAWLGAVLVYQVGSLFI
jgi:ferrous iron transport protein B